jgi:translation elongation factor P/translation initiation factor 5A
MKKLTLILILGLTLNFGLSAQDFYKYPISSGSVTYKMSMMGTDNTVVTYFKNNGNMQCTDMEMELFGMKQHNRTILKGNKSCTLDMNQKTYTEIEISNEDMKKQGMFLDEENAAQMEGVTKLGEEVILGKTCQIYSMNKDGAEMKFWTWKGLMLKMEANSQGMVISMNATAISESSPDEVLFEIPSDFTKN